MNSELKKEYAMRIAQANNVQMIIISYEIIETYLNDAYEAVDTDSYRENVNRANRCIEEMIYNLHYEYDFAKNLKELYLYMKRRLRQAVWDDDKEVITEVRGLVSGLKESYIQVEDQDSSVSLMQNTQSVMAGITYGRNQILDEVSPDIANRGYRV